MLSAQWDICNAMVLTCIMNVVSQDVYKGLVYSKNDATVWIVLNETYDKVDGSMVYNLLKKINSIKQGGSFVVDYYHRLNSLWREFYALTKLPKFTYEHLRSSLLTRDPLLEVNDAYNVVSREESPRGVPESSSVIKSKQNATSFVDKFFNNNIRHFNYNNNFIRGFASNVNMGPNPNLNCKHCGKLGHTIVRCFEIVCFPLDFKRNTNTGKQYFNANTDVKMNDKPSSSSVSSGFTSKQMQKLLSMINDKPSRSIHANMAGLEKEESPGGW
ncbi:hypothetical protein Tco_1387843 [Tanacetum coccineum]